MSEELKPPSDGTVEVSFEPSDEVIYPALIVEPETPPFAKDPEVQIDYNAAPGPVDVEPEPEVVQKARRGRGLDRSKLTPEELKDHTDKIKKKSRAKQDKKKVERESIPSATAEPSKAEAREVLEERGIKTPHILDTVYKLLVRQAEDHGVPANRYLFRWGIKTVLDPKHVKLTIPQEVVEGELLNRLELYALYDASLTGHEDTTFEEFLSIRQRCKSDTYYLGKEIFQNDFAHCHEVWRDFFPQWDPKTLPVNYSQRQAIDWLASQSELKDFLLMASRRAFKSSFARLWLISTIITFPDVRVLIVSETRPLAKDSIETVRSYFEATPGFETRFQRLFPEFVIPVGDGSVMSLEVPMRRLKLPQSIESSSMDSTVAGRRADIILFDDPISEVSCTNEVQILKSVNKRDLLVKLKERGGYVVSLGTPYAAKDLYYVMIERSKSNGDETFAYRVDPAFVVKPQALHKLTIALLPTLEESDIESFLFPEGLSWKELRIDLRNNPGFFMSQNLCIFPLAEDDSYRCQFDAEDLRARTKQASFFGVTIGAQITMSLDRAFSVSRYADFSCLCVGKSQTVEGRDALVCIDVKMDRWRESDLVKQAVDMIEKHNPTLFVAEQDKGWETLAQSIKDQCMRRGIAVPYFRWKNLLPTERAKAKRVKTLELPISDGRLWFQLGPWTEAALLQLEKFDGVTKSNSSRKDDFPDALSLLFQEVGPKYAEEIKPEDEEQRRREEEEEDARMRKQHFYGRMFGFGAQNTPPPKIEDLVNEKPRSEDPRLKIFGNKGPWRL